jgi:hypothetical protein
VQNQPQPQPASFHNIPQTQQMAQQDMIAAPSMDMVIHPHASKK